MKKYNEKKCLSCNVYFLPGGPNTLRCINCRAEHNRELHKEVSRRFEASTKRKEYLVRYTKEHREAYRVAVRLYRKHHPERVKEQNRRSNQARDYTKDSIRISLRLRTRLRVAIKANQKAGSAVRDLGCTIPELKIHLESQFKPGMAWGNYGFRGWHIDHIRPLAKFDLSDRKQFLEACHYTNLQPLWAEENLKKGTE